MVKRRSRLLYSASQLCLTLVREAFDMVTLSVFGYKAIIISHPFNSIYERLRVVKFEDKYKTVRGTITFMHSKRTQGWFKGGLFS